MATSDLNMASADASKNGLSAFKTYEDPAYSWIDLVAALKCGDPAVARACMQLAKESNWTHAQWELAIELAEDDDDPDWTEDTDIPNNPGWPADAPPGCATDQVMDAEHLRHLKQQQIDDFFEE